MKIRVSFYLCLFLSLAVPLQAGTALKAFLRDYSSPGDWVNVQVSIQQGQTRLNWKGPLSKGSLFYDRDTGKVSLVDPLHRSIFVLSVGDQTTLKLALALFAGRLRKKADGADAATRRALNLVAGNARAFFNGTPQLEIKDGLLRGFSCDTYLTRDAAGGRMREVWVTPSQATILAGEDYNTLRTLAHLACDLGSPLLDEWGADTGDFGQNFYGSDLPIQEVLYVKGKASFQFKVLGIESRDFEPSVFQLPEGYKTLGLLDLLSQNSGN